MYHKIAARKPNRLTTDPAPLRSCLNLLTGVAQVFRGCALVSDVDGTLTAADAQALAARVGLTASFPQPNVTRDAAAVWLAGRLGL